MQLDHVIYVADPAGLDATAKRLGATMGVEPVSGGIHTHFGTHNTLLPLGGLQYVEVVAVYDPAVAASSPFGGAVEARSLAGGGWLGWAVSVPDPDPVAQRLGSPPIPGGRQRPDGVELAWRQVGTAALTDDPLLPFFLTWDVPASLHPAAGGDPQVRIAAIVCAGGPADRARLDARLGRTASASDSADLGPVQVRWVAAADGACAGLAEVVVQTPGGLVSIG